MTQKGVFVISAIIMAVALGVMATNFMITALPETVITVTGIVILLDLFVMSFVGARLLGARH